MGRKEKEGESGRPVATEGIAGGGVNKHAQNCMTPSKTKTILFKKSFTISQTTQSTLRNRKHLTRAVKALWPPLGHICDYLKCLLIAAFSLRPI